MTEIKLYKSPWKALKTFAFAAPFIAIGIYLLTKPDSNSTDLFIGWFGLIFFGLGIPVGLFHLFDRRPQIIINELGIWDRTTKQGLIHWELIEGANPVNFLGQKLICLQLDKTFEIVNKQSKWATFLNTSKEAHKLNLHLEQIKKIDPIKFIALIKSMSELNPSERNKKLQYVTQNGI